MKALWPYPRIIAHRGGGACAPENTLAGLRAASSHGFAGVEFDVMLTHDHVAILMHDPRLGRTVRGRGSVAALTFAELQRYEAGGWFSAEFQGEPIPTYQQALATLDQLGLWANIEIKPAPGHDIVTGAQVGRLTAAWWRASGTRQAPRLPPAQPAALPAAVPAGSARPPLLSSFSFPALQAAQRVAPELHYAALVDEIPRDWQRQTSVLGVRAWHVQHTRLTEPLVRALRTAGLAVMAYTVNDVDRARTLFAWGVDAICTDRLDKLESFSRFLS